MIKMYYVNNFTARSCTNFYTTDMLAFHVVTEDALHDVLRTSLRTGQQGALSQDHGAKVTNDFLDKYRPPRLAELGVSRNDCLYLYLGMSGKVLDIADGRLKKTRAWKPGKNLARLALTIEEGAAYLSNLDIFDLMMASLQEPEKHDLVAMAKAYWQDVRSLTLPLPSHMSRYEIMYTKDVPATAIKVVRRFLS